MMTAWKEDRNITVLMMYDHSCGELDSLFIEIEDAEGRNVSRLVFAPAEAERYVFENAGTSGEDCVKVTGRFLDARNMTVMERDEK
jgi:hypothetical protein